MLILILLLTLFFMLIGLLFYIKLGLSFLAFISERKNLIFTIKALALITGIITCVLALTMLVTEAWYIGAGVLAAVIAAFWRLTKDAPSEFISTK